MKRRPVRAAVTVGTASDGAGARVSADATNGTQTNGSAFRSVEKYLRQLI
jgi:hypothetical protein